MVKATYVDESGLKKGAWSEEEDERLRAYVLRYGHWNWRLLPKFAGLERCGKSCRLRWMNYLKPGIKRGRFSQEERDLVEKLHHELGNKWSAIAAKLPGRTDNDIKNYCHTCLHKRRKRTSKSGQRSSERKNHDNEFAGSDVRSSAAPKLCGRRGEKTSVASSDTFILESSSSNSGDGVDSDSDKICSGPVDDGGDFSDLLSGFWTQPFMVDTYSHNHDYNFYVLDDGALFSPSLSCFDDNSFNMF